MNVLGFLAKTLRARKGANDAITIANRRGCRTLGSFVRGSFQIMNDFDAVLSTVPSNVSFGYSSLNIFRPGDLERHQTGYSVAPDGKRLWGDGDGDWRRSWVVVGDEGEGGDPIFVDIAAAGYPVHTAGHGEGRWDAKSIAVSLDGLREALRAVAIAARGREHPAALEENPITAGERDQVIESIRKHNPNIDLYFWKLMLGDDLSGESDG
jgi:hypothetical protein